MVDNILLIVATVAKAALDGVDGLEERFKAAMRSALDNGITTDEDVQFQAALGAVVAQYHDEGDDEIGERVRAELDKLRAINAASLPGVALDLATLTSGPEPIGLAGFWHEVKAERVSSSR